MYTIETVKILNGIYNISNNRFFKKDTGERREHSAKLAKKRSSLDIRKNTFSHRVADTWNGLDGRNVNCNTVARPTFQRFQYTSFENYGELEMWANAQRDGRPAEYRWRLCSTPQSLADAHY